MYNIDSVKSYHVSCLISTPSVSSFSIPLHLTGSPGCAMGGAATGDKSGRDSVDGTVKTGGGASGHDVQNTYKNTAPILLEAVLCVRLTAYYVISFLFPFVKRRYIQR